MISPSERPLPENTQHSQQTNIHASGGIRTHDRSRRATVDLRLRPRGYWDRHGNSLCALFTYFLMLSWWNSYFTFSKNGFPFGEIETCRFNGTSYWTLKLSSVFTVCVANKFPAVLSVSSLEWLTYPVQLAVRWWRSFRRKLTLSILPLHIITADKIYAI